MKLFFFLLLFLIFILSISFGSATISFSNLFNTNKTINLGPISVVSSGSGTSNSSNISHNDLALIQGGITNEYYHLTNAEWINRIFLFNQSNIQYNFNQSNIQYNFNQSAIAYNFNQSAIQYNFNQSNILYNYNQTITPSNIFNQNLNTTNNVQFENGTFFKLGINKAQTANVGVDIRMGQNLTQGLRIETNGSRNTSFSTFVLGDAQVRFRFLGDGNLGWGNGTTPVDTQLFRSSPGTLNLTNNLNVLNNFSAGDVSFRNITATDNLTVGNRIIITSANPRIDFEDTTAEEDDFRFSPNSDYIEIFDTSSTLRNILVISGATKDTGAGFIGIGTASPTAKLTINVTNFTGGSNNAPVSGFHIYNYSGADLLFVNGSSGNIGIGTTTPTAKLEVKSPIASGISLNTQSASQQVNFNFQDVGINKWSLYKTTSQQLALYDYIKNGNIVVFNPNGNIIFTPTNNIGIGTTTPAYKLDVIGNASLNQTLYVTTSGKVGIGTATPTDNLNVVGDTNITGNTTTQNLRFYSGRITNTSEYNCGGGAYVNGTNNAGKIRIGTGFVTSCGVNFNNPKWKNDPICVVTLTNSTAGLTNPSISKVNVTGFVLTGNTFLGFNNEYSYICVDIDSY